MPAGARNKIEPAQLTKRNTSVLMAELCSANQVSTVRSNASGVLEITLSVSTINNKTDMAVTMAGKDGSLFIGNLSVLENIPYSNLTVSGCSCPSSKCDYSIFYQLLPLCP